ncbi:MAG TPA: ankyrin repeat domain-containing protein [Kiritimatiellia bacterium]|nr:ankyrin repeat domain-containing protein [Kiritimatiellia bacterium]HMP34542.1 ankyrin repeat domain-containing protein [Kiritimatiellia bacterium]
MNDLLGFAMPIRWLLLIVLSFSLPVMAEPRTRGFTPLMKAAWEDDQATARRLLEEGAPVDAYSSSGMNALHVAAHRNHLVMMALLHEHGADLNATMRNRISAVAAAAAAGRIDVVEWLLDRGANIQARDRWGFTPLHRAAMRDHVEVVQSLIARGADLRAEEQRGLTPLMLAAGEGSLGAVAALIEGGSMVNVINANGQAAISYAILRFNPDIADYLADHGADLDVVNRKGETLVDIALRQPDGLAALTWLLDRGFDVNRVGWKQESPLHIAIQRNHMEAIDLLLARGASLTATNSHDNTPLVVAINGKNPAIVQRLLAAGADVELPVRGMTPLMVAATHADARIVELLLDAGADPVRTNHLGHGTFEWALAYSNLPVVSLLLERNVDPEAHPDDDWPAIMSAAWGNHEDALFELIAHGADPDRRRLVGQTPLMIAVRRGYSSLVYRLLDHGVDTGVRNDDGHTAWHIAAYLDRHELADRLSGYMDPEDFAPTNRIRCYLDLDAPLATNVQVAGNFNEWDGSRHPMTKRDDDGWWYVEFDYFPGTFTYKFIIDGAWVTDPAHRTTRTGGDNSVLDSADRIVGTRPERPASRADMLVPVTFTFHARDAFAVSLAGEFNGWSTASHPMSLARIGRWETTLFLKPGDYGYKFVVDGRWLLDPSNHQMHVVSGVTNSLLQVLPPSGPPP